MTQIGESFNREIIPTRQPSPGMGLAVARRTVFRESDREDWGRVADRVAEGNLSCLKLLDVPPSPSASEKENLRNAVACGALLTSGRHLQHGDPDQYQQCMEVYTNCSTSATTYGLCLLLLNGSGVGRSYDDDMIIVDWAKTPLLWLILSRQHPDYPHTIEAKRAFYQSCTDDYSAPDSTVEDFVDGFIHSDMSDEQPPEGGAVYHQLADSREGWAKAVEIVEAAAYEDNEKFINLNFSQIRRSGEPIRGMQDRPCTGPIPWIRAFVKLQLQVVWAARLGMPLWKQAMLVDHIFAEEVLVGDVRRAARMSTKSWRDPGIFEFIKIKNGGGKLWTSNNSVMVDREFWQLVRSTNVTKMSLHAKRVFGAVTENSFIAGEPGLINGDKLSDHLTGQDRQIPVWMRGEGFGSNKYQTVEARNLLRILASRAANTRFATTTNPCGEIPLHIMGGFCVIMDAAPVLACPVELSEVTPDIYHSWDLRVIDSIALGVRALVRVNLMDSVYRKEVLRTNRIGISLTGIHEWAWLRWGLDFHDLLNEKKSQKFWDFVRHLSGFAKEEANKYSDELGISRPFTVTTIKPSGSVSKIFNLTEGAHLPARREYLRWVQFKGYKEGDTWGRGSHAQLSEYESKGYPIKELKSFPGMAIAGFPTMLLIQKLGIGDRMVTATEATPQEQYRWLRLLEKNWLGQQQENQISYTLKINTKENSLDQYRAILMENQSTVKCCSVLPYHPDRELEYEYLPEQTITLLEWERIQHQITSSENEGLDVNTLRCENGVCPI